MNDQPLTAEPFTEREKAMVARILHKEPGLFDTFFAYGVYILPTALFAAYGSWNRDFGAMLVAYAALLAVVILYLAYVHRGSKDLHGAVEKYERAVGALDSKTEAATPASSPS